ncbi:MAG TPA: family 78 glycoside hydrolase catalytic domain [Propionibacteriaceae bacterium]|nr:family 78 glycoside hydrolase catalytic domain [Propionibacteriaceae bacterium]
MPTTWQGQFISAAEPSEAGDPAPYFRREVEVGTGLRRATLHITALGIVEAYVNGTRVGDEVLAPGWTSYNHRLHVCTHDVTALLTAGTNALGAVVAEGWAVGELTWDLKRHVYADRPALFCQLELEYEDGRTEVVSSDSTFRVGTGPVRTAGIYHGETYDARLESGWAEPGFDDSGWAEATPYEWDLATLTDTGTDPIRRIEELPVVAITTSSTGTNIVDFGQNLSGWVRLTVTGEAGQTVTLRFAEILKPDGDLERETNRTAQATDTYILRDGEQTWEPGFTFHGFRYVEVEGWPGELDPAALTAVVTHSDMTRTGWFETSNPLLNQLHANTVWSMRDNFVGVPTDCPQRDERLGWTGDLNAFAPTASYLYDVRAVLGSWLADLAVEQQASGSVPWVVPDVLGHASAPTGLWSDVAVSLPWALYSEYGDLEILRRAYPSMVAFIRQVEGDLDETGLWADGFQFGDWLDPDAPAGNPSNGKTNPNLMGAAYLCRTTRELADTAALLGETTDAEHFGALADTVREAFRREWVTASGRLANESATAYALAIVFGILDPDQLAKAGDRLAFLVREAKHRISTGFAGTPLVTDALTLTGHLDDAYRLLLQTECPSFLYPVTMGATTIWERWDSVMPDGTVNATGMTSLNHYALGAVADWMHRVVGGLQRVEPGWSRIRIAPQPGGDLSSAKSSHDTVLGRAESAWSLSGRELTVTAVIPDGASAEVVLPQHPDGLVVEVGPGEHSWSYEIPEPEVPSEFTMDTKLGEIAKVSELWVAVAAVLHSHYPQIPLDDAGAHVAGMSLNELVSRIPMANPRLADELRETLAGFAPQV